MKKKSVQDLDSDQVKIIYSLLSKGKTITEIFNTLKIPINYHYRKLKIDSEYHKEIKKIKSIRGKKSIQDLNSNQEKIIFSLLKEGRTIIEVFKIINIPIHYHQKRLENNPNYKKEINNLKSNNSGYEKYLLLSLLTNDKSNLKDLNKKYSNELSKFKKDKVFSVLWSIVEKK